MLSRTWNESSDSDDDWYVTEINLCLYKQKRSSVDRIKKKINFPFERFDIRKIKHMDKIIRSSNNRDHPHTNEGYMW